MRRRIWIETIKTTLIVGMQTSSLRRSMTYLQQQSTKDLHQRKEMRCWNKNRLLEQETKLQKLSRFGMQQLSKKISLPMKRNSLLELDIEAKNSGKMQRSVRNMNFRQVPHVMCWKLNMKQLRALETMGILGPFLGTPEDMNGLLGRNMKLTLGMCLLKEHMKVRQENMKGMNTILHFQKLLMWLLCSSWISTRIVEPVR